MIVLLVFECDCFSPLMWLLFHINVPFIYFSSGQSFQDVATFRLQQLMQIQPVPVNSGQPCNFCQSPKPVCRFDQSPTPSSFTSCSGHFPTKLASLSMKREITERQLTKCSALQQCCHWNKFPIIQSMIHL